MHYVIEFSLWEGNGFNTIAVIKNEPFGWNEEIIDFLYGRYIQLMGDKTKGDIVIKKVKLVDNGITPASKANNYKDIWDF